MFVGSGNETEIRIGAEIMTKRLIAMTVATLLMTASSYSQKPVFDQRNYNVAKETAKTTNKILDTNKDVLKTVNETLKAVTGERGNVAGQLNNIAIGNGFSVSSIPSFDNVLSGGVPNFGNLSPEITKYTTTFINGLKLVKSLSGKQNSGLAQDKSYEEMVRSVMSVSALVTGAQQGVSTRRQLLEAASAKIGTATDVKGSIDQNTQLQVQTGLTTNELIGVMNGAVQSLQAENQRKLTEISQTKKFLTYDPTK